MLFSVTRSLNVVPVTMNPCPQYPAKDRRCIHPTRESLSASGCIHAHFCGRITHATSSSLVYLGACKDLRTPSRHACPAERGARVRTLTGWHNRFRPARQKQVERRAESHILSICSRPRIASLITLPQHHPARRAPPLRPWQEPADVHRYVPCRCSPMWPC